MKKLYSLLALLAMVITFTACSSSESKPDDLPEVAISSNLTKTEGAVANKNVPSYVTVEFELSDYKEIEKYLKWVKKGTVDTKNAEIKFSNLAETADVKLSNVTLILNDKTSISLPDISNDIAFSDSDHLSFLQKTLDEIVSKKRASIKVEFTSNQLIDKAIKVSVNLDARFDFK